MNQFRAFEQLARDVLIHGELREEPLQPRSKTIDPRLDGVLVRPQLADRKRRGPRIVANLDKRNLVPFRRVRRSFAPGGTRPTIVGYAEGGTIVGYV